MVTRITRDHAKWPHEFDELDADQADALIGFYAYEADMREHAAHRAQNG